MNLSVLIPIWKRHDLTAICFEYLSIQQNKFGFDVCVVGSEGKASEQLALDFGFNYVEYSNEWLGEKMNKGLESLKSYDGVVVLGSDDFVTDEFWKQVNTLDFNGNTYYGFKSLFYYSTQNKQLNEFFYNSVNIRTVGAGRIYSKPCLESLGYKLWSDTKNNGLDMNASSNIFAMKGKEILLEGTHIMDVKHAQNITSHAVARLGTKTGVSEIKRRFSAKLLEDLEGLKFISGTEKVTKNGTYMENKLVKIRFIKSTGGFTEDQIISVQEKDAKSLIKLGKAVLFNGVYAPKAVSKTVEVEHDCTDCKDEEPCIPCEQKKSNPKTKNSNGRKK